MTADEQLTLDWLWFAFHKAETTEDAYEIHELIERLTKSSVKDSRDGM